MTRLSNQDVDACSRAVRQLYAEPSPDQFPNRVLATLSKVVPLEHATYNEFTPKAGRLLVRYFPQQAEVPSLVPCFAATIHTHPLFEHYQRAEPLPKRISDVASLREFKETAVYQEYFRHLGVKHQVIFSIAGGETRTALALNRHQVNFSERDRGVLAFLSPHISQAFQNARIAGAMALNLERIGAGLGALNRAVILAETDGTIRWSSLLAREWLQELFADYTVGGPCLPAALKGRLVQIAESSSGARHAFYEVQLLAAPSQRLTAYYGRANDGMFVIALARERAQIEAAAAEAFGLTLRESEILFWISEAKLNQEIGIILGISHRTVHKHVEHLFAKLGVDNRAEAQRLGWELRRL